MKGASSPAPASTAQIDGVRWGRVSAHPDERGAFREVWRASTFGDLESQETGLHGARFVQGNMSHSKAGVLRGLHYHRKQLDHWVVTDGEVFVALVDLRGASTRPGVATRTLRADDTVTIPPLVAHGFMALRPTTLLYLVTNEYDGTDELGIAYDDADLAIRWPHAPTADGGPILSPRDRSNPSLAEARRLLAS